MPNPKEKIIEKRFADVLEKISPLWMKCPKCHSILYSKDVKKSNRCPIAGCGYVIPYSVEKALKVENKLNNPKSTYNELSGLILEILDSIANHREKLAFLSKALQLVKENHEQRLVQSKQ